MAEAGGTSTQSGIRYQNSVAALHMGRMLDTRARPIGDRVLSVRVEAPEHVDDIVVRYADGATRFIQAKLTLRQGDAAWDGLWQAMERQRQSLGAIDRLGVVLADAGSLAANLRSCAERTNGSDATEWRSRLNKEQEALVDAVEATLGCDDAVAFDLFKLIDVELFTEDMVERDLPPLWMPAVADPVALHGHLRDHAGGGARTRALFEPAGVRAHLREQHRIDISDPESWGSEIYRTAVAATLRIEVPGTSIVRSIAEGFVWPTAKKPDSGRRPDFDDEWSSWRAAVEPDGIDLSTFPSAELDKVVVVAGPGFGKSTLLLALTAKALLLDLLPVLVTAPDLSHSDLEILEHIQTKVNASYGVSIDWRQAAESGLVVLLLDGLDEVGTDRRSVILDRLRRFSAIHPAVHWVLTVRDAAALSAPTEAKLVELSPLSDNAVRQFVAAYCPGDDEIYQRLHMLFESQPEMRRLSRIPLFLTMLLATDGRTGDLPKDRTDVIENYLSLLWDPARFKPSDGITTDPGVMRDVAQRAAFEALEKDEIGLYQRLLERMLPPPASSRVVIADLLKCGVLRQPEPSRFEFPFPIVQEYLAGCHLVEQRADDIPRRLASLAKRPWAQAIQFALERHDDPTKIVDDLLAEPDDAFDTHTRLLGRCTANGMRVSAAQRRAITLRLLARWDSNSFWRARAIGNLLADGFTKPLIPELRARLFERRLLHYGSGRVLCQLADDDLSLEILHELVSENVGSLLNLSEFQPEVDRVGQRAFRLYVAAAEVWADDDSGVRGVAALIDHLSGANVDQADIRQAVEDETLPTTIRAAALSLADPSKRFDCAETIAHDALAAPGWSAASVSARAAVSAKVPVSVMVRWAREFETSSGPEFIGKVISRCEPPRRALLIRELLADANLTGVVRKHALVFAMSFECAEAFDELLSGFGHLEREIVAATCSLLGHFPTIEAAERAKTALESRNWDADERRSISSSLQTGLSGKLEMNSFSSGSIRMTEIHPGTPLFLPLLAEWTGEGDYEPSDALRMTLDLVRLGQDHALADVRPRLAAAIAAPQTGPRDIHFQDHVIGNAVELLQDRREPLSLTELEEIARSRTHNARSSALRAIARQGTTAACESLMGLYPELVDASSRDSLLNALQTLAAQLGLRVNVEGEQLTVTSV
ncbi:NACHT domain-containing protein [Sphingomonas echinoides]|uniref:NACHT domain-containing protein n=1 Tax=Sphingomonas echinoides TaxID=59803 RepID=A0ABU4PLN5_9SPHN|nr:hypothetical protein [Sphingomonas echinoides]MDX5985061.1 hypothetical protein [Sphingomonas echinoides]